MNGHQDSAYIEEQWIELDGVVYRRMRWEGEEWSKWEQLPLLQFPWVLTKFAGIQ